jgi:peptide/nickel transport system permease protein
MIHVALYSRVMRAATLEVVTLDYVRTARAKGLSGRQVILRHVVRNSLLSMVTLLSLQLGSLLGGAIVIESVFSWPGLGRLAQEAVLQRDYNLLLGILLISAILVVVLNLVADTAYAVLDPRVEGMK